MFMMYFIRSVLTNMFRPLLQPYSGLWYYYYYYYKNTKVQMYHTNLKIITISDKIIQVI
jgi:hypothetical protein